MYWKAWGPALGLLIVLSLFLMQASRNLSDTWLAHWIRSINNSNVTITQSITSTESKSYTDTLTEYLACIFENLFSFRNISECRLNESVNNVTQVEIRASENSYYLAVYIGIAVFNSLIALIRSFAFAYAGIKAAKFIHDQLLNSVIFVRIDFFIGIICYFFLHSVIIQESFFPD